MRKCVCPFCMDEIRSDEILFNIKKFGEAKSARAKKFLQPAKTTATYKEDPWYIFWEARNYVEAGGVNQDDVLSRCVKSRAELISQKMEWEAKAKTNQSDLGDYLGKEDMACAISLVNLKDDIDTFEIYEGGQYHDGKYHGGVRIGITQPVCPVCQNVLPDRMFKQGVEMMKVALAANITGGKTCLMLSWLTTLNANSFPTANLNNMENVMSFTSLLEAGRGLDDKVLAMLDKFKQGTCPKGTARHFVAPIFFSLIYKPGGDASRQKEIIMAVYDTSGEVLTGSSRNEKNLAYLSYIDGILFMMDPNAAGLIQEKVYLDISPDQEKRIYQNIDVESYSRQCEMQDGSRRPVSVRGLLENRMRDPKDTASMDGLLMNLAGLSQGDDKVLAGLRSQLDREDLSRLPISFSVSKCDTLRGSELIEQYHLSAIFDQEFGMSGHKDARALLSRNLQRMYEERIPMMEVIRNSFSSCSVHMIAPLGCEAKVMETSDRSMMVRNNSEMSRSEDGRLLFAPIRTAEPLQALVLAYARAKGWQ